MSGKLIYGELPEANERIHELEQIIQQQQDSNKRLTLALQSSEIGAWDLDFKTGKGWRTLRHDQIFGYSELQPEWTYEKFLTHVVEEDRAWVDRMYQEALSSGVFKVECRINANGAVKWIAAQGRTYLDTEGKTAGMMGTVADINAQKEAEQERLALVEESNRMKSNFVATMSHEMRTPLNAIIGITEILTKSTLDNHQRLLVSSLDSAGRSLLSLINDILDLSKLEAGKFLIENIEFSLVESIKEALYVVQPHASEKNIDLKLYTGSLLPVSVKGDPQRLKRILVNIVSNALKFSRQNSEADIFVFNTGSKGNSTTVRFVVFDTGIGVSEADQTKLFTAFSQIERSSSREHGGSGLGLSICRHLVKLMNGEIGFVSTKDVGSAFWFDIPFECDNFMHPDGVHDLHRFEIVFTDDKFINFELLLQALAIKSRRLAKADIDLLKAHNSNNLIFIDDLFSQLQSSKPSLLFNQLADYAGIEGRIENFRSDKENLLPDRQTSSKSLRDCGVALLVEDNAMNQIVGKLQLEEIGFNVDVCSSGMEALRSVSQKKYSIIFMDCHMPEMDGYKTSRAIRNLESKTSNRTPIVAVTASVLAGEREKCLAAGMDDYLSKPVDMESLYKICSRWLAIADSKSNVSGATDATINLNNISADKIVDRQGLIENVGEAAANEIMELYIRDCGSLLLDLDDSLKNKNLEGALFAAHTLHGASRIIKAERLAESCKKLELSLNMDNWENSKDLFSLIQTQHKLVLAELRNEAQIIH